MNYSTEINVVRSPASFPEPGNLIMLLATYNESWQKNDVAIVAETPMEETRRILNLRSGYLYSTECFERGDIRWQYLGIGSQITLSV